MQMMVKFQNIGLQGITIQNSSKGDTIMGEITKEKLNGIDTEALKGVMKQISEDPPLGKVKFLVTTTWKGTTKSETVVQGYEIGGQKVKRIHTFVIDEPLELLGNGHCSYHRSCSFCDTL
jgi:hypothetical protein